MIENNDTHKLRKISIKDFKNIRNIQESLI